MFLGTGVDTRQRLGTPKTAIRDSLSRQGSVVGSPHVDKNRKWWFCDTAKNVPLFLKCASLRY